MTQSEHGVNAVTVAVHGQEYIKAKSPNGVPSPIVFVSVTMPSSDLTCTSASPFSKIKYSDPSSPC